MNSNLDLNLLLITRLGSEALSEMPDLYATAAPRRTARGREADSLVIYLSLTGNAPLSPADQTKLMGDVAQKFYKTSGSLTAALRAIAESVNLYLLDRNLRSTGAGHQGIGQLLLVALRGDAIFIAESGAVQAYLVRPAETQALLDLQTSGRGLGLSRATPLRFLQINMAIDDYLVLSTIPASDWTDTTIKHPAQGGLDAFRHQLMSNTGQKFNAVLVQAQPGRGKLNIVKPTSGARGVSAPSPTAVAPTSSPAIVSPLPPKEVQAADISSKEAPEPAQIEPLPDNPVEYAPDDKPGTTVPSTSREPAPEAGGTLVPADLLAESSITGAVLADRHEKLADASDSVPSTPQESLAAASTPAQPAPPLTQAAQAGPPPPQVTAAPSRPSSQPVKPTTASSQTAQPAATATQPPKKTATPKPLPGANMLAALKATARPVIASFLTFLRNAFTAAGRVLLRLLKNLLPDADVLHLPASTMVFIAIAIPLVLAVLGGMVFLQRGQAEQHQVFYQQAVEKADYAATLTNPLEQRLALQTALGALDKAEEYTITSQSQALRVQLTSSLDALDAVKRLDYKQAIVNGLDSGIKVTRIVASAADLYLLDGNTGSVLHAVMTSRGYELDPTFMCGPTQGPIDVGPLIDIVELPPGGIENASLLGMDANGNLLYCVVGAQPYSNTLAPPNAGLGNPVGLSLDREDLYVLDPTVNAVWIYRNMEVSQPPRYFFGDEVPPMQDVIDMEVYNDDLYMLHADGHTTKCTYSGMAESPTRCEDPYPYSDNRPGRTHGPVIEDAIFSQIDYITFPERSIFYLDPQHQAIYYFSVLLTLQYQYQPKAKLAQGEATAFSISANRIAFLAIGNDVYYAAMP